MFSTVHLKFERNTVNYCLAKVSIIQFLVGLVGFKRINLFYENNVCRANEQNDLCC